MFEKYALLAIFDIVQRLKNNQQESEFKRAYNEVQEMIYRSDVRFIKK